MDTIDENNCLLLAYIPNYLLHPVDHFLSFKLTDYQYQDLLRTVSENAVTK